MHRDGAAEAVQFRHAQKAQAVANFSKLVELQYQLRQIRVNNPSLASVHQADVQNLHSDREIQEYFLNLMQLSLFEIACPSWSNITEPCAAADKQPAASITPTIVITRKVPIKRKMRLYDTRKLSTAVL